MEVIQNNISLSINDKDLANIKKLRELVKEELTPYYDTDFNLLRWLQGHHNNFEEIVPKLKSHLAMRKSNFKLDIIADGPRNNPVHSYWESGLTCEAELTPNCIVNVEQTGANDYWGILHKFSLNEILMARIYDLETMLRKIMEKEKETGHQHSIMYIMDLSGLHFDSNLITMLRGALRSLSTFITEHYVELIRSFVLVNAPEFISMIWSIAKPLLPEKTRQKVIIMGASHWRREILEMATPKALPAFWNESSENGVFLAELNRSKPVDRNSLYKSDPKETVASGYYKQLNVSPGKSSYVDLKVEKDDWVNWKFETDGHFSFGFYFVEDEKSNQWKMIYPRLNHIPGPTYVPMSGQHKSEMTGIYRLFFSNEHSWFHVLKIR